MASSPTSKALSCIIALKQLWDGVGPQKSRWTSSDLTRPSLIALVPGEMSRLARSVGTLVVVVMRINSCGEMSQSRTSNQRRARLTCGNDRGPVEASAPTRPPWIGMGSLQMAEVWGCSAIAILMWALSFCTVRFSLLAIKTSGMICRWGARRLCEPRYDPCDLLMAGIRRALVLPHAHFCRKSTWSGARGGKSDGDCRRECRERDGRAGAAHFTQGASLSNCRGTQRKRHARRRGHQ